MNMENNVISFKGLLFDAEGILTTYIKSHNQLFAGNLSIYLKKVNFGEYEEIGTLLLKRLNDIKQQLHEEPWNGMLDDDVVVRSFSDYLLALEDAIQKFTFMMSQLDSKSRGNNRKYSWLKHRKEYKEYNKLCKEYGHKGNLLQEAITKSGVIEKDSVGTTVTDNDKVTKKVKVFVKGYMSDIREEIWDLNENQINEFCDSDGFAYGLSCRKYGKSVNSLMNKTLWDRYDNVAEILSDQNLTEQQKAEKIKCLSK